MGKTKPIIYQVLPRLFTNYCDAPVPNGSLEQNGSGKFNAITDTILGKIAGLGVTHVWYTGVIEHAHDVDYSRYGIRRNNPAVIKGKAGSPYAITDYYDVDPDLAEDVPNRMAEFEALIERTHKAGLKVIIDFVPNHVGREYHSDVKPAGIRDFGEDDNTNFFFSPSNNFYYITRQQFAPPMPAASGVPPYVEFPAKASGNDAYTAFPGVNDWYETVKLNYGRDPGDGDHFDPIPDTWLKMLHILRFWAAKKVDGFRCDMAHMVPLDFWQWAIPQVRGHYPKLTFIAEIYDVALYRRFVEQAGFDYLYDKVNLYDTLRAIETGNCSAAALTNCWQAVDGIGEHMLNFLENHDEQRFASPFYAGDAAKVEASLVVSAFFNRGPFMLYFGQELGEPGTDAEGFSGYDGRTTIFDYWSVATVRRRLNHGDCKGVLSPAQSHLLALYRRILHLANDEAALAQGSFFDLMYVNYDNSRLNPHRHFAFLRHYEGELIVIVVNFSDEAATIAVNIPLHAFNCLDLPQGIDNEAVELITGAKAPKTLSATQPFEADVAAHGAVMWKLLRKRLKPIRRTTSSTKHQRS